MYLVHLMDFMDFMNLMDFMDLVYFIEVVFLMYLIDIFGFNWFYRSCVFRVFNWYFMDSRDLFGFNVFNGFSGIIGIISRTTTPRTFWTSRKRSCREWTITTMERSTGRSSPWSCSPSPNTTRKTRSTPLRPSTFFKHFHKILTITTQRWRSKGKTNKSKTRQFRVLNDSINICVDSIDILN